MPFCTQTADMFQSCRYDPVMYHIHAFTNSMNKKVTGEVKLKLYKGQVICASLSSPYSLFKHHLATFEKDATFNQNASAGFIELYNLAQKTSYNVYDFESELFRN